MLSLESFLIPFITELDVVGHAHAFGLLRLPKVKELLERDTSAFKRADVDTSSVPYL